MRFLTRGKKPQPQNNAPALYDYDQTPHGFVNTGVAGLAFRSNLGKPRFDVRGIGGRVHGQMRFTAIAPSVGVQLVKNGLGGVQAGAAAYQGLADSGS